MTDLAIGLLQDTAAGVLLAYGQDETAPHAELHQEQLQVPFFEDNWADKPERCLFDHDFKSLARSHQVSTCVHNPSPGSKIIHALRPGIALLNLLLCDWCQWHPFYS